MHEVRGKDGVGAKMDSMELEREKGITIRSAATHTEWGKHHINIIDTPGHVDFTIEVERSLQVLDGAIMIVCASSGVQSQTITVDRQMRRYNVPRICFVNKCDRTGANPYRAVDELRSELNLHCALVQIPIGVEDAHEGLIDLIEETAIYFDGAHGDTIRKASIPENYKEQVHKYRLKLLEVLGEVNPSLFLLLLLENDKKETFPDKATLKNVIRAMTIERKLVPVFVGSAYKNKGVQTLLDGVIDYLPSPLDLTHYAIDLTKVGLIHVYMYVHTPCIRNHGQQTKKKKNKGEDDPNRKVPLSTNKSDPLLFYAFKLEQNPFGQLTWVRVYQGTLRKSLTIQPNNEKGKKLRLSRIVRMHSDELQDINTAHAGDICAMFVTERISHVISPLHVPDPVVSLAVKPKNKSDMDAFGKAFERFVKEDPTFHVEIDDHTGSCIFSGMGELHLDIYIERILREYKVPCETGKPRVKYHESITKKVPFDYLHKKQTGGRGQYARIIGYFEPVDGTPNPVKPFVFINNVRGQAIPPQFIKSVEVGFKELCDKGPLVGGPVVGLKIVLEDGVTHEVDSSDLAFRNAAQGCFRSLISELGSRVSEPCMDIEICVPEANQGAIVGDLSTRGMIINGISYSGKNCVIRAYGPLDRMFGYATDLRSLTEGKGEFTMEYKDHQFVDSQAQESLVKQYQEFLEKKD
ncbi:hypothetical protein RFI_07570 [Reticulomyxa filosa]|uniref:Tr-type G domain-containing protein n=1 Tax=Reticulomyxa filosa TaxID=46433 RepID=X6NUS9_RETFI|nr:hypothetical protein RFI_07570 [Reticulomyxa filosa]|eukprot:ETO29549.1 hypothetical protein RFI_07570 [Reticulomyxa filosa]